MTTPFEMDPEAFSKAADKTLHVRDRINEVWSTLETATAGRGAPWGDDKLGNEFAEGDKGYKKSKTSMEQGKDAMNKSLVGLAAAQRKTGKDVRKQLEDQNRDGLRS
ncbi:hypothetical protein [Nocardia sp. BMG51109]|uniref:hypothetical protein n=1 Tax=Nocardia sp. BMG51109 TaxID=1056816 RepID=UPI0004AFA6C5|nr:hypothetical protein [Nocardia sp. BMG51109]